MAIPWLEELCELNDCGGPMEWTPVCSLRLRALITIAEAAQAADERDVDLPIDEGIVVALQDAERVP